MRAMIAGRAATVLKVAALAAVASMVGVAIAARTLADRTLADSQRPIDWSAQALTDIHGARLSGTDLAGRVVLLVNTASRCAFTPQYEGLEALWDAYGDKGLTVLGVPSNDFGGQEPGANGQIAEFCASTYSVSFPMLSKAAVTGPAAHPLYKWARLAAGSGAVPGWNFHKILIGRDGTIVATFPTYISPRSPQVMGAVEAALRTPAF